MYRDLFCGQVNSTHVGKQLQLSGFVDVKRDHGQLIFIDLRDHSGLVQCIFENYDEQLVNSITRESVIQITGTVHPRDKHLINPNLATGEIEIRVEQCKILSHAKPLPIDLSSELSEEAKLRYRYLYLRSSEKMHHNIQLRSQLLQFLRGLLIEMDFTEVQTPILTGTSPEGARDFLVPSRLHPGKFYALPQAPQQFKQLLMASGINKYFQIAPCFRDEDSRADRSPGEFYQLDCEMAYATQEMALEHMETIITKMCSQFWKGTINDKFPLIKYNDAMRDYCSDKPDLRNPLKFTDVTEQVRHTDCHIFQDAFERYHEALIKTLQVTYPVTKKHILTMEEHIKKLGLGGLAYIKREGDQISGTGKKLFEEDMLQKLLPKDGLLFVLAGDKPGVYRAGAYLRQTLFETFDTPDHNHLACCFITDYPLFDKDPETKQLIFSHNPFSMPQDSLDQDPNTVKAWQYDLVINGIELASGAIRNHIPELMFKAFNIVGYTEEDCRKICPALIDAFQYGTPPHGGFAIGFDRLLMILCHATNIREVIAFPLTQTGQDLLMRAPSSVDDITYLGLQLIPCDE